MARKQHMMTSASLALTQQVSRTTNLMELHGSLTAALRSLDSVPREFAAAAAKVSQARHDLADDERRLTAARNAMDTAALELEATTKVSRRVSGFLTGRSKEYKREAELAERSAAKYTAFQHI